MGIVFRHDAAAVALPSNNANRKYGQQLVLQQQRQKYQAQQAGYERMFQLGRDSLQNRAQFVRDMRMIDADKEAAAAQREAQAARDDKMIQADKDQIAARTQAEQQQFMRRRQLALQDQAFETRGNDIRQSIQNKEFDPDTARRLQANLQAEADLQGSAFDDPQRIEGMQKIQKERESLLQKRLPVKTEQQMFDEGIVTDSQTGMRYRRNGRGEYEPLPGANQPRTAQEFYTQNPEQKKKDFAAATKALESSMGPGSEQEVTPEMAWEYMQDQFNKGQKLDSLISGGSQSQGTPLPAQAVLAPQQPPADTMSANPWKDIVNPATASPPPAASQSSPLLTSVSTPDFGKLAQRDKGSDLTELQHMKDIYDGLPPQAQQAMNVILSDSTSGEQKAAANRALKQMGINLQIELGKRAAAKASAENPAIPNEFGLY